VPDDELESSCLAFAQKIAAYSPAVLGIGKRLFYQQADLSLDDAYGLTAEGMACNMMFEDAAEGIDAFLQKRAPAWSGR
jgi:enoyl-CoA hydratase/carnithine racemase